MRFTGSPQTSRHTRHHSHKVKKKKSIEGGRSRSYESGTKRSKRQKKTTTMADLQRLRELASSPSLNERRHTTTGGAAKEAVAEKTPVLLVCLEGLIGVGKSTVLAEIEAMRLPNVIVLYERVDDWKAVEMTRADGRPTNMLGAMYSGDLSSAVFQLAILQSRFGTLVKALCDDGVRVVVSERGTWSEKLVFAKSNLNANEFKAYSYTQEAMLRELFPLAGPVAVGFLYLTLDVDDVLARIATRGRTEEKAISKEYMATLQAAHANMQITLERDGLGAPNIVGSVRHVAVDANRPPAQVAAAVVESIERLLSPDAEASRSTSTTPRRFGPFPSTGGGGWR